MTTVADIEDAILQALSSDAVLSGYVRAFAVIPTLDMDELKRLTAQVPAIGVIAHSGVYGYAMPGVQQDSGAFSVLCIHKNLRAQTAAMRGAAPGEYGVWTMIDHCRAALRSGKLLNNTVHCQARSRCLLWAGEGWAAAALEVECLWRYGS